MRKERDPEKAWVFVHVREPGSQRWQNEGRAFRRVPCRGEHFALDSAGSWYEVQIVVHVAFEADYDAEVYAVHVDHHAVHRAAQTDIKGT